MEQPPPSERQQSPEAAELLGDDDLMHLAYERVLHLIEKRPIERLETANVDVTKFVTTVLGALPKIMQHRNTLAQLVSFDVAQVDHLKSYALALGHAHAMRRAAHVSRADLDELVRRQRDTRKQLKLDARALASRGLLDPKRLAGLRGGSSVLAVAFDVIGLVELMLESWNTIATKTAVTAKELVQARADANRLVVAVGRKRQARRAAQDDPDVRTYNQIYTALARAYSEVRAALRFIRRAQGDADFIAPSPYPGRAKRSRSRTPSGRAANAESTEQAPQRVAQQPPQAQRDPEHCVAGERSPSSSKHVASKLPKLRASMVQAPSHSISQCAAFSHVTELPSPTRTSQLESDAQRTSQSEPQSASQVGMSVQSSSQSCPQDNRQLSPVAQPSSQSCPQSRSQLLTPLPQWQSRPFSQHGLSG